MKGFSTSGLPIGGPKEPQAQCMCSYDEALERAKKLGPKSKWPNRKRDNRLEPEAWPAVRTSIKLKKSDIIFTIGSCFARNVEEYLFRSGFNVPMLDFGVPRNEWGGRPNGILNKYTPATIFQELDWAIKIRDKGGEVGVDDIEDFVLRAGDDEFIDVWLGGMLPVSGDRVVRRRQEIYDVFKTAFDSQVVIMTLGLIEAWWDNEREIYIQEMPTPGMNKLYPNRFMFDTLSYEKSLQYVSDTVGLLSRVNEDARVLLTVSPVPLGRSFSGDDVLIANTYSKSTLRSVAGYIVGKYDHVDYFPAYETVMLTKQKYVWHEDLVHPSDRFVKKIVEKVLDSITGGKNKKDEFFYHISTGRLDLAKDTLRDLVAADVENALYEEIISVLEGVSQRLSDEFRETIGKYEADRLLSVLLDSNFPDATLEFFVRLAEDFGELIGSTERYFRRIIALIVSRLPGYRENTRAPEVEPALRVVMGLSGQIPGRKSQLGILLTRKGYLREAEQCLREAIDLSPAVHVYHRHLSNVLVRSDDLEGAIEAARSAVKLSLEDPNLVSYLGTLLARRGDSKESERCQREAIRNNPLDPSFHRLLSGLLDRSGNLDGAIASAREAIRLGPKNHAHVYHRELSSLLDRSGDLDGGISAAREAVRLAPDNSHVTSHLGNLLTKSGRNEDAERYQREAIRLDPKVPAFHRRLSGLLNRSGNLEDAIAAAREAVRLGPGNENVRSHLATLVAKRKSA